MTTKLKGKGSKELETSKQIEERELELRRRELELERKEADFKRKSQAPDAAAVAESVARMKLQFGASASSVDQPDPEASATSAGTLAPPDQFPTPMGDQVF